MVRQNTWKQTRNKKKKKEAKLLGTQHGIHPDPKFFFSPHIEQGLDEDF